MQDIRKFPQTISLTNKIYYLANYNNTNYTNYANHYKICMVLEVLKVDFLVKNLSIFSKTCLFFLQNSKSLIISDFFFSKTQINLIKIKTIKTFLQKITVRSVQVISHVTELISKSFYKITVIKSTKTYFVKWWYRFVGNCPFDKTVEWATQTIYLITVFNFLGQFAHRFMFVWPIKHLQNCKLTIS